MTSRMRMRHDVKYLSAPQGALTVVLLFLTHFDWDISSSQIVCRIFLTDYFCKISFSMFFAEFFFSMFFLQIFLSMFFLQMAFLWLPLLLLHLGLLNVAGHLPQQEGKKLLILSFFMFCVISVTRRSRSDVGQTDQVSE